jgi:peptidoglycan/xylan/chitin deacetylase (PgdA/CDA1 family)
MAFSIARLGSVLRACAVVVVLLAWPTPASGEAGTPILAYHRFGPAAGPMMVRTSVFETQLEEMAQQGYTVIPLRALVAHLRGGGSPPPSRSVVITVDDGHRSVYTELLPVLRRRRVPVTLFVYPSAISNATYALTWDMLRELGATGLVDVHSHTYWHPNFVVEKRRLAPRAYARLVDQQLTRSKSALEDRLGTPIDMLSWPFGIHDDQLMRAAAEAGYVAAVTLERRHATAADQLLALPRYLVTDDDRGSRFRALIGGREAARRPAYAP